MLFSLKDDGVVNDTCRGTVDSDADVFDGHVCSTDDATALHPSGDHEKFCGIANVCVLFNLKDYGVVDGARRGTFDSGYADMRDGHVRSTEVAKVLRSIGDNDSICGIANTSLLFSLRDDGVVDCARRRTVNSDADVFDGHVCSTDDATDLHPDGDNNSFCGIAYVCLLYTSPSPRD